MNYTDKDTEHLEILKWYRFLLVDHDPFSLLVCPKQLDHFLPFVGLESEKGVFIECLECGSRTYPGNERIKRMKSVIPQLVVLRASAPDPL